jgi:hypothetical protein
VRPLFETPHRLRLRGFSRTSVGYFAVGLLEHLDPARIDAVAYTTSELADGLTDRIAGRFSSWKSIVRMSDEEAAACIHEDGIHILLDLAGHTAQNRLPMFAIKPAPVQASWLGYFATTGLAEMDFLLADAQVAPASEEWQYVERIVRLPDSYLCFSVPDDAPPVADLPCLETGHITFGSFNNIVKLNDDVVALWARVLDAVPGSRLFLKTLNLNDAETQARTLRRFGEAGIEASRITLEGSAPRREYLASYARVDIALDPFPYPGAPSASRACIRVYRRSRAAEIVSWRTSARTSRTRRVSTRGSRRVTRTTLRRRLRSHRTRAPFPSCANACATRSCARRCSMPHATRADSSTRCSRCGMRDDDETTQDYLSLVSLYVTCLRATGSNFLISIFSGIVFLFLDVV